jgi:hypothetical protein
MVPHTGGWIAGAYANDFAVSACLAALLFAGCLDQQRHGGRCAVIRGNLLLNAALLVQSRLHCALWNAWMNVAERPAITAHPFRICLYCTLQDAWTSSDMVDCVLSFAATRLMNQITANTGAHSRRCCSSCGQ